MREIITTCYLDYVGLGYFDPSEFRNPREKEAKDYNEPDECCNELYEDLLKVYKNKFKKLGFELSKEKGEYILWMDKDHISYTLSSDFIGPSRAFARDVGISNREVGEYLRKTRVIGGHTLWPVQYREDAFCKASSFCLPLMLPSSSPQGGGHFSICSSCLFHPFFLKKQRIRRAWGRLSSLCPAAAPGPTIFLLIPFRRPAAP